MQRTDRDPSTPFEASTRWVTVFLVFGALPCGLPARAQDWGSVPIIEHSEYQAVNPDGSSAYAGPVPFRLRGVVLNSTEDWLSAAESYNEIPWNLGGEAEIFVQAVDLDATPWDPDPSNPFDDFGGTFAWMGQCYGNLPFVGDPAFSYIDQSMAGQPGESRPLWYDELDRLGYRRPGTPLPDTDLVRPGDLVEIRARVDGFNYQGKHNVNERHTNAAANDYEVVILQKKYGLPDPAKLALSVLKDASDDPIFDPTRQTGGERYQGERVQIRRVRLTDLATWASDSIAELHDGAGRTLGAHLGLSDGFDTTPAPWGYFHVTGILDQQSPTGTGDYRLLVMSAADFVHIEGDTNRDWDVDNTDLGTATGNFTGPGSFGKTWAEGDSDGDGDVDNTDLGQAFGNFTGPVLPPAPLESPAKMAASVVAPANAVAGSPDRADLLYDPAGGEVFLDQTEAAGGIITNFVLGDAEAGLITGVVHWPYAGSLKTDLPYEISQTDPLSAGLPADVWSLGPIFPAGLDQQGLESFLDQATYVGELGSGMYELDLVALPEPATLALLATALAAGAACGALRRRGRTP